MFRDLFSEVVSIVNRWVPQKKYDKEPEYRDDLIEFLRRELNKPSYFSFGPPQRISVRREASKGLCDIAVDRKIGIELKKDLSKKKQVDRLIGQIVDYKKDYEDILIVLVGNTNKEALELLKDKINDLKGNQMIFSFSREPRIKIIDKGSTPRTKRKEKSPFGFDLGM